MDPTTIKNLKNKNLQTKLNFLGNQLALRSAVGSSASIIISSYVPTGIEIWVVMTERAVTNASIGVDFFAKEVKLFN